MFQLGFSPKDRTAKLKGGYGIFVMKTPNTAPNQNEVVQLFCAVDTIKD